MAHIAADSKLQERVAALPDVESFVALANDLGFEISAADIIDFSEAELSDDDLAYAAGGSVMDEGPGYVGGSPPSAFPTGWLEFKQHLGTRFGN